jgi:(2S)-methylsuccinyl-CoA dehydrogenase
MAVHTQAEQKSLREVEALIASAANLVEKITAHGKKVTQGGRGIDDHQILTRRIAGLATKVEAARQLLAYARAHEKKNGQNEYVDGAARLFAAEVAREVGGEADQWLEGFGLAEDDLAKTVRSNEAKASIRQTLAEPNYRALGQYVLAHDLDNNRWIWSEGDGGEEEELRAMTRRFARTVVAPKAEEIHRHDLLVPEEFIQQMAELGFFGMSIPAEYGGVGMSNLMMIIATEELSAASLSAAGSLITRPEILAKALLKGGTEEQKKKWLEPVATGQLMVGVAVTEPNVGSDVASLTCRATPAKVDGIEGYVLDGAKAWCTFAGRANILALLARTDSSPDSGHKGLSLFIVEKDPFEGHEFEMVQSTGGKMTGKADPTPGYRGMHSFTLAFDQYFVPAENLVGGEGGKGKGFYLQMGGFEAGRLQTGGRAIGVSQASLEAAAKYALERPQFGKPIAEFQSTQYEIGWMAAQVEAARQLTYAAARAMDRHDAKSSLMAAMAKFFSCRVAVNVSQRGQLLHGGWGYAEEYAISRYTVDALVLPIFEGVEPILEMKVIGRGLLAEK